MKSYLLKTILPKFGLYADFQGRPCRELTLATIPRIPAMPNKAGVLKGLNDSRHYGKVREVGPEYRRWLFETYFNPWAAAWFQSSVYMWWAETYTKAGGGGGSLPWIRSIITSDNVSAEDEVHELCHIWEEEKIAEGLWTPHQFTGYWLLGMALFPEPLDRLWAKGFERDVIYKDKCVTETFASTGSHIMGDLVRLPSALVPYYEVLFTRR